MPSLKKFLLSKKFVTVANKDEASNEKELKQLQEKILRIQEGIWHRKSRAIIVFEGFDAAGKGGVIRRLVEPLDPRGFRVHPIAQPLEQEQGKHYLYRFWQKIPAPGTIAIFDRSWYGRVLVEKIKKLASKERCEEAYDEINEFERTLMNDGIELIKIFIAIDKKEQLKRFEERLKDPYKQWKLSTDDVDARAQWNDYVKAVDKMFERTSTKNSPWHLVAGNDKRYTRVKTLDLVSSHLKDHWKWMESKAQKAKVHNLEDALGTLVSRRNRFKLQFTLGLCQTGSTRWLLS